MRILSAIAGVLAALTCALHAHRTEGLLQSSLVEVLPSQVGVEVTLAPEIDIAPKIMSLLDLDSDAVFSENESEAWSELFMAGQRVTVDGQSLPLTLQSVRSSPLAEMTYGHAEIVVHYTADLVTLARVPRTIVCANRYEPIPCTYQCNGLVPKAPGVRIHSHRRDERQRELTLAAEFFDPAAPANLTAPSANISPRTRPAVSLLWLVGLSLAAAIAAFLGRRRNTVGAVEGDRAPTWSRLSVHEKPKLAIRPRKAECNSALRRGGTPSTAERRLEVGFRRDRKMGTEPLVCCFIFLSPSFCLTRKAGTPFWFAVSPRCDYAA